MEQAIIDERRRKALLIYDMYKERKMSQSDIAMALGIPVLIVGRVTQAFNYKRTILKTPDNRKDDEIINMVIDYTTMNFLDKYKF